MIYVNGVPIIFNKTIRPRRFLIYFVALFLFLTLLTFLSLPDLTPFKSRKYPLNTTIYKSNLELLPNLELLTNPHIYTNANINFDYNEPISTSKLLHGNLNINKQFNQNQYLYFNPVAVEDALAKDRRDVVKEMMKFAWDGYWEYAKGYNELKPISRKPHLDSVFGAEKIGLTIVDSLDTLLLMNLTDEYKMGFDWVKSELSIQNMHGSVSVFETNIRYVGSFLTCYLLTRDEIYLEKAMEIADALMPAFDKTHGLPYSTINLGDKSSRNYVWAQSQSFILSEIGTLHLEYMLLSKLTGHQEYADKVLKIREYLANVYKEQGLVNNYINPSRDANMKKLTHVSLGGLGDSYYEYLIKSYLITNYADTQAKSMFDEAMKGIRSRLVKTSSPSNLVYLAQIRNEKIEHKMDHLACFFGGLMSLTSQHEQDTRTRDDYSLLGQHLTETCHISYQKTPLGLGPEVMSFEAGCEADTKSPQEQHYILRPETFESYFYLWRHTHDPKYREYAWQAVQALQNYTRTGVGFSGVRNVYAQSPAYDDVQQSYFMSEALKYLYLIFCPDELLPLDKWIFNTEGHPFLRHDLIDTAFPSIAVSPPFPNVPPPPGKFHGGNKFPHNNNNLPIIKKDNNNNNNNNNNIDNNHNFDNGNENPLQRQDYNGNNEESNVENPDEAVQDIHPIALPNDNGNVVKDDVLQLNN